MSEKASLVTGERSSNLELLKILAIFLIIIFHVNQTVTAYSIYNPVEYTIDLSTYCLVRPVSSIVLTLFQQFGEIGNTLFFICSAWFLLDSDKKYGKKAARIIIEVCLVSLAILGIVYVSQTVVLDRNTVIRCFFPTTFNNNWYITSYILFLIIFPFLNRIIDSMSQKQHLLFVLFIIVLRIVIDPVTTKISGVKIGTRITFGMWISLYFIIAYLKKYLQNFSDTVWKNIILLFVGIIVCAFVAASDTLGLKNNTFFNVFTSVWIDNKFYTIVMAISLFNLFRKMNFKNRIINKISKYTLYIYILHENILVRKFYRPMIMTWVYRNLGYEKIILWILLLAVGMLVCSILLSAIIYCSIGKLSVWFTDRYYPGFRKVCGKFLEKLSKIH